MQDSTDLGRVVFEGKGNVFLGRRHLHVHERGITVRRPFKETEALRYEEMQGMRWKWVSPPVGMVVNAEVHGAGRTLGFAIRMPTGSALQQNLDALRYRIAEQIASRARARIQAGQPFTWGWDRGPRVRLQHDGIAYWTARFLGGHDEHLLPWTSPFAFWISNGTCFVYSGAEQKKRFSLSCADPDFYPGLALFASLGKAKPVKW